MQLKRAEIKRADIEHFFNTYLKEEYSSFIGMRDRPTLIHNFLQGIPKNQFALTDDQFLEFARIFILPTVTDPTKKKSKLIANLRTLFRGGFDFFELLKAIPSSLMDGTICMQMASLPPETAKIMKELFDGYLKDIVTKQGLLGILSIIQIPGNETKLKDFIVYVGNLPATPKKEYFLNGDTLKIMKRHEKQLFELRVLFTTFYNAKKLVRDEQLNFEYIYPLSKCDDLTPLISFLQVTSGKLILSPEIIDICCKHKSLGLIAYVCEIMNKYSTEAFKLDNTKISALLNSSDTVLNCLAPLIGALDRYPHLLPVCFQSLMDSATQGRLNLKLVDYGFALGQLMDFFHTHKKLNKSTLMFLVETNMDLQTCLESVTTLQKFDLLNDETLLATPQLPTAYVQFLPVLNSCIPLDRPLLDKFLSIPAEILPHFQNIVSVLLETQKELAAKYLPMLFTIKYKYWPHIDRLSSNFHNIKALNERNIEQLFKVHIDKMEIPAPEPMEILEVTSGSVSGIVYKKASEKNIFFDNNNSVKNHGYGQLKEGLQKTNSKTAVSWQLKIFDPSLVIDPEKAARNETKHRKALSQDAFYAKNPKTGNWEVLSKKQSGCSLASMTADALKIIPFETKLRALIGLLKRVDSFHAKRMVHGNITLNSCFVEDQENHFNLCLEEFTHAHKVKTLFTNEHINEEYRDKFEPGEENLHLPPEMHAVGIVTAHLFPEYIEIERKSQNGRTNLTFNQLDAAEPAAILQSDIIFNLLASMTFDHRSVRATSKLALNYCEKILAASDNLDAEQYAAILKETIQKETCNHEDILQDRYFKLG